ncbi:cell division regulator GpsB [Halobacillus sp. ACCC02827]|uniref:cell division regulator GpsB n=1 Tax=Bacillaceae TaxID=186817 RepID=UPI0002A4E93E|nr:MULTISPECIES: cell division regulator GpsB [Bacillaceae]ELK45293.1 cell cycle protein GpsB [Halobacillus sp. BAB-2008]QHT46830.1 cell division regulator GpsB [Bacillus sp. SB49]WJE14051.1 cell division regulator GpsB [Halobacillus sp. ACCC02827]
MNSEEYHLTGKAILEKDFKTSMRGYNQEEVDEYLDLIIQDYDRFQQEIERLQQENERLKKLSSREQAPRQRQSNTGNHQVNYDILKRVSNLEKAVFGNKYAD